MSPWQSIILINYFHWKIKLVRDNMHMTSIKTVQFSRPHPPLSYLSMFKILSPPWPWTSNFKRIPPLQTITNQLRENIIQGRLLYVIGSFLQVGFRFQYQLINFAWLSFDFFSFSWSLTVCFCLVLYSCMCCCWKVSRNVFYL